VLILCVILSIFVYGMIAATLGVILPDLSARFALTPRQNGVIAFAQALGLILASLGAGPLLDFEGDKIGLIIGLICIVIALTALPRCRSYWMILVVMFLMGTGGGVLSTGAQALAVEVGGTQRAVVLNLSNLFFGLGGFVTPFIAANIFAKRPSRLCDSISGLALGTLLVIILTPMHLEHTNQHWSFRNAPGMLMNPALLLFGFLLFLYVSCEVGMWNWLPRYLIARGVPESSALNVLSFGFALGLLAGRVLVAPILTHFSALSVVTCASAGMAVTTYLMLRTRRTWSAIVMVALAGLMMAPVYPTTLALVGGRFQEMTATALGIAITFGWIGLAVSSRLIGGIAAGDSKRLGRALLVLPCFALIMLVVCLFIGRLA
jgi:fucose permease